MEIFKEVKSKVDIVSVIGSRIELKKSGRNYLGLCPFHKDSTPSLYVSRDKKIYTCFSCKASGDVTNFVSEFEQISQIDAAKKLNDEYSLKIQFKIDPHEHLYKANEAEMERYILGLKDQHIEYLKSRGIEKSTIKKCGIGADRDWVCFPIRDLRGRVLGFNKRNISTDKSGEKYWHSSESPVFNKNNLLTGLWESREYKGRPLIITESQIDTYLFNQLGYPSVSCLTSKLSDTQIEGLIDRYSNIILALDNDEMGIIGAKDIFKAIKLRDVHVTIKIMDLGVFKDAGEYLKVYDKIMLKTFWLWAYDNSGESDLLDLLAYEGKHIELRRACALLSDKLKVQPSDIFHDVMELRVDKFKLKNVVKVV